MTTEEISTLAASGAEMPDGLDSAQQRFFQSLRLLYAQHRLGVVSPEQGTREKAKIVSTYEMDNLHLRANATAVEIRNQAGYLLNEKSDCEVCRRVARILDGRKSHGKSDDTGGQNCEST